MVCRSVTALIGSLAASLFELGFWAWMRSEISLVSSTISLLSLKGGHIFVEGANPFL